MSTVGGIFLFDKFRILPPHRLLLVFNVSGLHALDIFFSYFSFFLKTKNKMYFMNNNGLKPLSALSGRNLLQIFSRDKKHFSEVKALACKASGAFIASSTKNSQDSSQEENGRNKNPTGLPLLVSFS